MRTSRQGRGEPILSQKGTSIMIALTRLDDSHVVINADLILTIEKTPDTVVTLTTGARIMVKDSVDAVVDKTISYRRRVGREVTIVDRTQEA